MVALDETADILMSTPIVLDDIYSTQEGAILVWTDPELGQDMACSFNVQEGCDEIVHKIRMYQQEERGARASGRLTDGEDHHRHKWTASVENLPAILDAVGAYTRDFGWYVRDHGDYVGDLVGLFEQCQASRDTEHMEMVGKILVALLQTPFNTEGKILSQFVSNEYVDRCIDVLQYALGKRDKASGFISTEERRASFRNPCHLSAALQAQVHILYAAGFLKDLFPLSLDEGDPMCSSVLGSFMLRIKFDIMRNICASPETLPKQFYAIISKEKSSLDEFYDLLGFVNDMTKTVKTSVVPLDDKEGLLYSLIEKDVFPFLRKALDVSLSIYQDELVSNKAPTEELDKAGRAVQMVADTVNSCLSVLPVAREDLLLDAAERPATCTLGLLLRAATTLRRGAELRAVFDAVQSCCVGLIQPLYATNPTVAVKKQEILSFWVRGSLGASDPPLFGVMTTIVELVRGAAGEGRLPSHGEEIRIVYGLKLVQTVAEVVEERLCSSLSETVDRAALFTSLGLFLQRPVRALANLQSSIISLVSTFFSRCNTHLLKLFQGEQSIVSVAMELLLSNPQRNNLLFCAVGHLFDLICKCVHNEKSQSLLMLQSSTRSPYVHELRNEDSMSRADLGSLSTPRACEKVLLSLHDVYGERMGQKLPFLAHKVTGVLHQTPEEARHQDEETYSIASTSERQLSEYEALATEFGLDVEVLSATEPMLDISQEISSIHSSSSDEEEGEGDATHAPKHSRSDDADGQATAIGKDPSFKRQRTEDTVA
ncbi:hypothetical protein STCU_09699 [Strigomonas culicis]|nr:hypothetical protein STCU_09699 [Strigomonas culicis]|eukprot:EPY18945.1 hypothetical protein STCU_09699 [Strigomonas culicis]